MQIVLQKEDIEQIIKSQYKGVTSISFSSKNPKVTLEMETPTFEPPKALKTLPITQEQMTPSESKPAKLSNEDRAQKGGMAGGGVQRSIQHIG